ncbi:hypothetical protein SCHPADRAFT_164442 [Schizopora paradoxa]|uniref:Uncharacterized protein n=1 Tax=Schizopora paradoxa TaxID=27342 RepID=A0A0H2SKA1_9AGAM|nr:hypothetical protein SCHPADRAFT_164442 [Schizopora paradoxa]
MESKDLRPLADHKQNALRAFSSMLDATECLVVEQQANVLRLEERLQASEDANAKLRLQSQSSSEKIERHEEAIDKLQKCISSPERDVRLLRLEERFQALVGTTAEDRLHSSEQIRRLRDDFKVLSDRITAPAVPAGSTPGASIGEQGTSGLQARNQNRSIVPEDGVIQQLQRENEELRKQLANIKAQLERVGDPKGDEAPAKGANTHDQQGTLPNKNAPSILNAENSKGPQNSQSTAKPPTPPQPGPSRPQNANENAATHSQPSGSQLPVSQEPTRLLQLNQIKSDVETETVRPIGLRRIGALKRPTIFACVY